MEIAVQQSTHSLSVYFGLLSFRLIFSFSLLWSVNIYNFFLHIVNFLLIIQVNDLFAFILEFHNWNQLIAIQSISTK